MSMSQNPYAPPTASLGNDPTQPVNDELARRFTRFAAAMVDGILMMAIIGPVMFATGYLQRIQLQEAGLLERLVMALLGMGVMLAINGYLLYSRGQTIGKLLTGIQIVDVRDGRLLPFLKIYVYRYLWLMPLVVVVTFIPGTADDALINLLSLVDALVIFGGDRRCLHDYIAGSKVVLYQADRPRAA